MSREGGGYKRRVFFKKTPKPWPSNPCFSGKRKDLSHEGETHPKKPPTPIEAQLFRKKKSEQFVQTVPLFFLKVSRSRQKEFAQTVCANCFYLGEWFLGCFAFPSNDGAFAHQLRWFVLGFFWVWELLVESYIISETSCNRCAHDPNYHWRRSYYILYSPNKHHVKGGITLQ